MTVGCRVRPSAGPLALEPSPPPAPAELRSNTLQTSKRSCYPRQHLVHLVVQCNDNHLLQERRDKHDQRNVQRESRGAPSSIDADDLVCIGCDRGGYKTIQSSAFTSSPELTELSIQKGRSIIDRNLDDTHGAGKDIPGSPEEW